MRSWKKNYKIAKERIHIKKGVKYVIYQGKEKLIERKECTIVCTNNWNIDFEDFDRHIDRLKDADGKVDIDIVASSTLSDKSLQFTNLNI